MPTRVIAVDWSGAAERVAKKLWLAEVTGGQLVRLENGRDRAELVQHLIEEAARAPDLVVGLDFAFSLPAWFLEERQLASAPELWEVVAREGERWLAECAPPFWGRPGKPCPPISEPYRRTEREAAPVGGIRPKSVFQIGGAGAVGTGSLRGMPALRSLREAGFSIWPFDPPWRPLVVEIYPRVLTGAVMKGNAAARDEYLADRYPRLGSVLRERAVGSEDAFDAAVSAIVMASHLEVLAALTQAEDVVERREGRIWAPQSRKVWDVSVYSDTGADRADAGRRDGGSDLSLAQPSRTAPGNDPVRWQELVATMLPPPVRMEAPGVLVGGDPGEVVVRIEAGRVVISRYGVRWIGHVPERAHVTVATFEQVRARTAEVARAVARARAARLRAYGWCACCREVNPPEWMHDETICQQCAQQYGIVY